MQSRDVYKRQLHFHMFRHTYTSKLLANRAAPKAAQGFPGQTDISTAMNVCAYTVREKRCFCKTAV